jgi:predicted ArsR family transcriptional regulator
MCMMCIEFQKGRMNIREVAKALMETTDEKHGQEIIDAMLLRDPETAEQFQKAMKDALSEFIKKTVSLQKEYAFYSQCDDTMDEAERIYNEVSKRLPVYNRLLMLQMRSLGRRK